MASTLPEPIGIKTLEVGANSVYLRWAITSQHGLSDDELKALSFEFRSTDGKLNADCTDHEPLEEYKARLCGLSENKRYRFQNSDKISYSEWSSRIEFTTRNQIDTFIVISNEKEIEIESVRHRLRKYMAENKKLQRQIGRLQEQLDEKESLSNNPGHWQWDEQKIVAWIMRIKEGMFKQYEQTLLTALKEQEFSGKMLVLVNESDLKDWGITNFQHKKVLIHYIQQLTENDTKPEIEYDHALTKNLSVDITTKDEEEENDDDAKVGKLDKMQSVDEEEELFVSPTEQKEESEENVQKKKAKFGVSESVQNLLDSKSPKQRVWKYKDGMLSVLVVKATNVDNMDEDDGPDGVSDPYVELDLKGNYKTERTTTKMNDANPVWNEKRQLLVDDAKNDVLKCTVYDHDKWTRDDKIGEVNVPIITILAQNGKLRKEFDVIGSKNGCKLELDFTYWEPRTYT